MPAVEVAVAAIVTLPETVEPLAGDVIEVPMPVVLMVKDTGTVWGELEALGSLIVAAAL